jgi:hypothetical protein
MSGRALRNHSVYQRAREIIRRIGPIYFAFVCLEMLGLPLTLIGASAHVHWLFVTGLVVLVVQLVDMAVIWPIIRAWWSRSR